MKTEIIPLADFEAAKQFAAGLGITLSTVGGASFRLELEGRDEQRYGIDFTASATDVLVNNAKITPKVTLAFTALKVVGD